MDTEFLVFTVPVRVDINAIIHILLTCISLLVVQRRRLLLIQQRRRRRAPPRSRARRLFCFTPLLSPICRRRWWPFRHSAVAESAAHPTLARRAPSIKPVASPAIQWIRDETALQQKKPCENPHCDTFPSTTVPNLYRTKFTVVADVRAFFVAAGFFCTGLEFGWGYSHFLGW